MHWVLDTQSDSFRAEIMGRVVTVILVKYNREHIYKSYREIKRVRHHGQFWQSEATGDPLHEP